MAQNFTTYAGYTNPNAICPVCGASVFFYQSPTGGRVFFDELGPPWPKHPCTDNAALPVVHRPSDQNRALPKWRVEGWEPVRVQSSRMEGSWHVILVQNLLSGLFFDVLATAPFRTVGDICAAMKPWDANGWGTISFVDLDGVAEEKRFAVFERKRFFQTSPVAAAQRRTRTSGG